MPVRLQITLLFAVLSMFILGLVCGGVYYFFYTARLTTIKTRLTNRAITTARLLELKETFDLTLVRRIDSLTTIALENKTVQAYDAQNKKIYNYSDLPGDTLNIDGKVLENAREKGSHFFSIDDKEAIAYNYGGAKINMVVISAGEDKDGKQSLQTLGKILAISFIIGIAFVLVSGYIFSTRLLMPVKKITSDVEEISAQNLSRRIKTGKSKDEWYKLASTLNDLLNRLQESFDLQSRFISNASHELSTPLTSISSQIEVSLQRDREAKEYKEIMQSIYQDVKHMGKLTQTLLELTKASANTRGLEINLVRIDEILLGLPAEINKINSTYSVTLNFENLPENEEDLFVLGSEALLLTAIKNIVINACKYSSDHHADIFLEVKDKTIITSIGDKGKGIPETEIKTIFQPFYRVDDDVTKGFGLGLSLADKIIKLHRGHIEVSSTLNVGSKFSVFLPSASFS